MKWTPSEATKILNEIYLLNDKSAEKLRWYVKQRSLLKNQSGELIELSQKQYHSISEKANSVRNSLRSYEQILEMASDNLIHPIRPISGIYFLIDSSRVKDGQIVYVGQAKSIMNRLSGHFWKMEKEFDKVAYLEIPIECTTKTNQKIYIVDHEQLDQLEAYYIWHLKYPKYNKSVGVINNLILDLISVLEQPIYRK